ncbi:hypothetical protein GCM10025869_15680 [Homoserinibacter gongjuensis]|uniref:Uncharacterized protein n=1 Tax=Homoserinibacter gongjuensis TaxID=1162968 RepID=A0ABQ6JV99_9MICO|nr:hypothetical protein GCM10025869_15680 [Homoserinibacter gongjuensis]
MAPGCDLAASREALAVERTVLAPHARGDAREREHVALVRRVDDDARAHDGPGCEPQPRQARSGLLDRRHRRIQHHLDAGILEPAPQDALGDVRLGPRVVADGHAIMLCHVAPKARREPAQHPHVADIGVAEPARHHAAEVPPGFEQHDLRAVLGRRDGCCDARGGPADHHDLGRAHPNAPSESTALSAAACSGTAARSPPAATRAA